MVKLDTLCFINNKYVEITNVFILLDKSIKKNIQLKKINDFKLEILENDIYMYFYEGKYMKCIKRIWEYSIVSKNKTLIKLLLPILKSNISRLTKIIGEIEATMFLLEILNIKKKGTSVDIGSAVINNRENNQLINRRIINQIMDIQNNLYDILDNQFRKDITLKISKFFFKYYEDFWNIVSNGFKKNQKEELLNILLELKDVLLIISNNSILDFLKDKIELEDLIKKIY